MEVTIGGQSLHIQNINISSTPQTGLVSEQPGQAFLIKTRNQTEFRVYESDDPTGPFLTVPAGTPLSVDVAAGATKPFMWVRTTSGTDVLEILSLH